MKQSIQLRLGQHLTMTPQLQQAIRLLQLSSIELQVEVQQALESNLMLETEEEEDGSGQAEEGYLATPLNGASQTPENGSDDPADDRPQSDDTEGLLSDSQWEDDYDSGSNSKSGPNQDMPGYEGSTSETLREHLLWQMRLTPFSETDRAIAIAIIDSINDDGYLSCSLDDIISDLQGEHDDESAIQHDDVEAVLHRIQGFDPQGIAARDLRESLLIQLQQYSPATPWIKETKCLVDKYLDLLANRDYAQLRRQMKMAEADLCKLIDIIQSLNPRPGGQITDSRAQYVVPDVYVRKHKGAWVVDLNPDATPRLRVNSYYASLIHRAGSSTDVNCLKNHLQEARWFIKSLNSRNETLLKVATCIVEHQIDFLEHGEEAMKALVLHQLAEDVGMHESTISRITTQKYMYTPRGIFELKYFFSSHVSTTEGGECSATAIRALIKKLVSNEEPTKPLSDSKIASTLLQQNINIARRTIAKYRESLAIPPSNERKRLI